MSSIDHKIVRLIDAASRQHILSVLKEAGIKKNFTVEEIEEIWRLGIRELPEYKRAETAVKAETRLESVHIAYVLKELGERGMVSRAELQERLDDIPGPSDMTINYMSIMGLVGFFTAPNNKGKDVQHVFLTTEGRARYEQHNARLEGYSDEFLAPLDDDEKQVLFNLLIKLTCNFYDLG